MNGVVKLGAVGALTLVLAACSAHQAADEGEADRASPPEVTVEVENQNFYDARVYMVEAGRATRLRLGSVPGNGRRTFSFRVQPTRVRFVIDYIGGGQLTTDDIRVSPGDELVLSVTATTHRLRIRG